MDKEVLDAHDVGNIKINRLSGEEYDGVSPCLQNGTAIAFPPSSWRDAPVNSE
jgi:hypothetical protein